MMLDLLACNSKVSYHVQLSGQFTGGFPERSPSGRASQGVGCLTVRTLMWPSWCKAPLGTLVLRGLLQKIRQPVIALSSVSQSAV